MIKDIVVHLEHDPARDVVRDYAISIAELFEAYLAGVSFGYYASLPSFAFPAFPADVLADILAKDEAAARAAVARFEEAARRSGISTESRLILHGEAAAPEAFSFIERRFDLGIIMQSDPDTGGINDLLLESALFGSGRPMIAVPYIQKRGVKLDLVTCCWDGSRTAARAINDALPFLRKARTVELFIIENEKTRYEKEVQGVGMASHLARHGVNADVELLPAADIDVGNAILSHVADRSVDMIVMGGYGHSRFREFVLGGTTREILSTMTVPVFMSH
jgi:nucleotide-binding universal stress UspA family protein